jgi:hypothetical protein
MAEIELGSKEWFKGLFSGLAQAGMGAITNALTPRDKIVAQQQQSSAGKSPAIAAVLAYVPYILIGAVVLVLVLVIRRK